MAPRTRSQKDSRVEANAVRDNEVEEAINTNSSSQEPATTNNATDDDTPALSDQALRMNYRVARGEQGVLTFEPYKSLLLPLWRFRTVAIARKSAQDLRERFDYYGARGDFVGMDMARKFIQMGMTRAKRYANYKGGRKYDEDSGGQNHKRQTHEGHGEKLASSEIFKKVWEACRKDERYLERKGVFLDEQKEWDKENPGAKDKFERMIKGVNS